MDRGRDEPGGRCDRGRMVAGYDRDPPEWTTDRRLYGKSATGRRQSAAQCNLLEPADWNQFLSRRSYGTALPQPGLFRRSWRPSARECSTAFFELARARRSQLGPVSLEGVRNPREHEAADSGGNVQRHEYSALRVSGFRVGPRLWIWHGAEHD